MPSSLKDEFTDLPISLGATSPVTARPRFPVWLVAVLLVLATIALYWPATRCDFVNYDDDLHVTANVHVQEGLTSESIQWALLNPVNCIWHPLTTWSHALDCQLFGLNPWGHHLSSVLLHAVNTGLVFLLLRGLTGALWRSVAVAALFGWHPLRVESVAWVAERKDVLSGFFGLLAVIAYARYVEKSVVCHRWSAVGARWSLSHLPPSVFYLLSLFLLALGLMSKPVLVTWPCVMLLLDYWPLGRMQKVECRMQNGGAADTHHAPRTTHHARCSTFLRLVREKAPFFVLAALMSVVTFLVQRRAGALAAGEGRPLGARLGNALIAYCRYLGKLFWPTDLVVLYPHPGHWPLGKVLLAGGLILGISVLLWVQRKRYPFLLMGWLWYCGTLVPMSQVIQTGGHGMADRYTYLPSLGVLILTTWGAYELTRRWRYHVMVWFVTVGAAIAVCLALTRQQLGYWQDSEALFRRALAVTENNWPAHSNLGNALAKKGQIDEAIRQLQAALRLKPDFANAYNNLGYALFQKGQMDEAIRQFEQAIRLEPVYADAHNNLGYALFREGEMDEAIRQYQEALRLKPDLAEAHSNLGKALGRKGQTDEAIRQLHQAIRLKPDLGRSPQQPRQRPRPTRPGRRGHPAVPGSAATQAGLCRRS